MSWLYQEGHSEQETSAILWEMAMTGVTLSSATGLTLAEADPGCLVCAKSAEQLIGRDQLCPGPRVPP